MTTDEKKARDKALRKAIKSDYHLVPMMDIDDEARLIAVAWVEGFEKIGGIEMEQKHKLASDIMNYSRRQIEKYNVWLADLIREKAAKDLELQNLKAAGEKLADVTNDYLNNDLPMVESFKQALSDWQRLKEKI